jgi:hypothetical protein
MPRLLYEHNATLQTYRIQDNSDLFIVRNNISIYSSLHSLFVVSTVGLILIMIYNSN